MLIINGGLPRSGTVLVGAIICAILRRQGVAWQRYNPQERRELPQLVEKIRDWPTGRDALLVHTHVADHSVLDALSKRLDAIMFWNHRDPRDVVVSLRRLHDLTLDKAIRAVQIYARVEQAVTQTGLATRLRYEDIISDPHGLARTVAECMAVTLTSRDIEEIVQETSIDRHRRIMQAVQNDALPEVRAVATLTRTMREDPETLINDRHIQSGASGRWRDELTSREQSEVSEALGPYVRHLGYPET